jgi:hypothetical protein
VDRYTVTAIIVVAVLALVFALMAISWRRRRAAQSSFDVTVEPPADFGAIRASGAGLYLATTPAGDRLNRIAVGGLGFRARLDVVVSDRGILLPFPGGDVFIPAADLTDVGRASWTIDRGIEPRGITVFAWRLADRAVESFVRLDEPTEVETAARSLLPAPAQNGRNSL